MCLESIEIIIIIDMYSVFVKCLIYFCKNFYIFFYLKGDLDFFIISFIRFFISNKFILSFSW